MNNPKPSFAIDSIVSFGIILFFLAFVACNHHTPTATASLSIFAALISSGSSTQTSIQAIDPADIVFDRNTTGSFEIYRRASNDGSVSQITNFPSYDSWWPRISPDRTKILFYRALTSNNKDYSKADLFTVNADGTSPTVIRPMGRDGWVFQAHAEWSPDGSEIVMSGATGSGVNSGILQIFVTDSDGVFKRQITNTPAGTWNCDPSWSPDGQTIVYNHYDSGDVTNLEIYTIPSSGIGTPDRLTNNGYADYDPYFSPDGLTIAWLQNVNPSGWGGAGVWAMKKMESNGASQTDIINDSKLNSKPAWSRDGLLLYFHRMDPLVDLRWKLYTIQPDGTNLVRIDSFTSGNCEYPSNY